MAGICVYEHDCHDFSTTGLVGELLPVECYFEEEKNGSSGLSLTMYYDADERWKALKVGNIIKASVPVRVPPALVNGQYIDTVDISYINNVNLQQFAVKMDLQQHSEVMHYNSLYGDKECTNIIRKIPFTGTGGRQYELVVYSDGTQVTKIVGDGSGRKSTGGYTRSPVVQTDTLPIPQRFSGLEAAVIPTRIREQFFVIESVEEYSDSVEVKANHIWYSLLKNYTTYKSADNVAVSGYSACKNVMSNALSDVGMWSVESDVDTTLKELDYNQKNLVETFLDPENGICAKYGAVLLRDNWDFYVIKESNVGYDRGFVVEYGQNMLDVQRSESIENVATRIIPFGKDSSGKPVYMTGTKWVDSENIGDYPSIMVELLDCSKEATIGKNGTTTQNITEKLRTAAQKRFTDDKVDLPEVEMTINFLSLGDTEEYAQYRGLDKVYLYDKITVKDRKRGYNYAAEVTYVKHNVLTGQLEEVKIGSIENSDGVRKVATWQVPQVNGENIRLKSIQLGAFSDGAVDTDALANGSVTALKIANLAVGEAQIDNASITNAKIADASITNAKINSAGIEYAKIKELNAESAYFGQSIFEEAVGGKLYVPRLLFDTAQGRQMLVKDLVIGASNGKYYKLDINDTGSGISMTPTELTVSQAEIEAGHTNSGQPIIGTTATVTDLATTNLYAIDALIDKITAKRINVDELWARQAFINKLQVQDLTSNTYIHAAIEGLEGDISDVRQTADGVTVEVGKIKDGTTAVKALDNTKVSITSSGVSLKTGGTFTVASGNFSLDSSGNVTVKGNVQASSGSIGGWTIGTSNIHAGSGSSYVALSTASNVDYAIWAGASSAGSAPFRVKKDGTVYSTKLITLNEQGTETVINLRNYSLWKLGYDTVKNVSVSNNVLTIETTRQTVNFSKATTVVLSGDWSGNDFTVSASDSSVVSIVEKFSATKATGTSTQATYTVDSFNANHKAYFLVTSTRNWAIGCNVDATSQYNAGASSVTVSGLWSGRTYTATASNGEKATTTTSTISEEAAQGYNSTTHNFTVYAYYTTGDGTHQNTNITVNGARAYNAGVSAGEAEFTKHESSVYTVTNSGYASINLGYWQGSTSPPSGFHSVGTGFYQIAQAASTWYTKD